MSIAVASLAFVGTGRSGRFSYCIELEGFRKIVNAYPRRDVRHIIVMCFFPNTLVADFLAKGGMAAKGGRNSTDQRNTF